MATIHPKRHWPDLSWPEFRNLGPETVAILPVAAIEQHGPHLPLSVDACINRHLLAHALDLAPPSLSVVALPMQEVGASPEHADYPGTLSLSADTLCRVCLDLGESVRRAGVRRLVLLNSHGGNPPVLDIVAQTLRGHGLLVVCASWAGLGTPPGLFSAAELAYGIHGGEAETSLMLHFRPDLVDMAKAENFVPWPQLMASDYALLSAHGAVSFGWQTQDLHPSGACGNAAAATAEKGRMVAEHQAAQFALLLAEIARYPLDRLRGADTIHV